MYTVLLLLLLALLGCGDESLSASDERPPLHDCSSDVDCPLGLRCEESRCVDDTGLGPELPEPIHFRRPVAIGSSLLILSTEGNSVAILEPTTQSIRLVALPLDPVDLAALPDGRSAVVLSRASRTLTFLGLGEVPSLVRLPLGRAFERLSVSADGRWALLWTPDGSFPPGGTEGLVALVDLDALAAGNPSAPVEKVVGRRQAAAFFRGGTDVVVVAQNEVAIFRVGGFGPTVGGERLALPETHREPATREVLVSPDGSMVLLRSLVSPDLILIDVAERTLTAVNLPGTPSDLALSSDGSRAVAVLRDTGEVVWFALPFSSEVDFHSAPVELPGRECETSPCFHPAGSVSLSEDGRWAALYSTASNVAAFAFLDLEGGGVQIVSPLHKWVRQISLSADGSSAIVIHRAEPDATIADPYEREVRRSEGYTAVDRQSGSTQLQLTGALVPGQPVFPPGGRMAAVPLSNVGLGQFRVDAVDRQSLMARPHALASAPEHAGALEAERVWITQTHPLGRISFLDLLGGSANTLTGFALNGEIE